MDLETLLEQLPGNIFWKDKNNVLVGENKAHALAFSHGQGLIGESAQTVFPKEEADWMDQNDLEVITKGKTIIAEEPAQGPNGEKRTYFVQKSPWRNEKGEIIGVLGQALDISEAKKTELDHLAMLESVIARMPGYVYWVNKEGRFLGCNDNEAKLLGLSSRRAIVGKTNQELLVDPLVEEGFRLLDHQNMQVIQTGQEILKEEHALSRAYHDMIFWSNKAPLRDASGEVIGMVGISMDISQLKRVEAELKEAKEVAEAASKAKSDFVAVMSHEFRTPLTGALGMLDILVSDTSIPEAEKNEHLGKVKVALRYLLSMVNNILDFAKLDAKKLNATHIQFNLFETIEDVFRMLEGQVRQKELSLDLDYPSNLPKQFIGDPQSISQILINLIGNAAKFTEVGGITVSVEMQVTSPTDVLMEISVEDTGIGIPQDKLEKIFEEFEQVGVAYSRHYSGTGLGLTVSKRLVELMQGKIFVESQPHRGSRFVVELPLTLPVVIEETEKAGQQLYRMLLVEDDPLVQLVHQHKLEKLGYQVVLAKDGKAALSLFESDQFDFVFMDIGLPDISGYEVIGWMRKIESASGKHTPIVALTAYSDDHNLQKMTEMGADEVLCKPVETALLQEVIEHYLPRKDSKE